MSLIQTLEFQCRGDERGSLVVIEDFEEVPFEVKRIYYLYGLHSELPRGFHAHRKCVQVAICIQGSCEMIMDDGVNKETVVMNSATVGVLIDVMQWHEMHNFSSDCIFMVLASDKYDEADYIRNYDEFLNMVKYEDCE